MAADAVDLLMARAPRPHRARRRLRDLGRPTDASSSRPPTRWRRCPRPHGVFAMLGNHDDDRDMPAALDGARLHGAARRADADHDPRRAARPVGIRYWTRKRRRHRAASSRGASANLDPARPHAVAPDRSGGARSVPLMLSGHTHGGQIVLPGLGAIAAREFPVVAGRARRDTRRVFVSRGVGTVYIPVRVNCPPEVAVLTLAAGRGRRRADARAQACTHEATAVEPPLARQHEPDRVGIERGAPLRGCAPPASPRCRRRAPARPPAGRSARASSSPFTGGRSRRSPSRRARGPVAARRRRETPAAATGGC